MIKFTEAKEIALSYAPKKISWEQALAILKTKSKYTLKGTTGLLRGYGFEVEVDPAKLKFYPAGIEVKTPSARVAVFSRGVKYVTGSLWSGDDSSVIIDIFYSVGETIEKVQIIGQ
jgi:hypothetical protein